jgi:hypothetical protein
LEAGDEVDGGSLAARTMMVTDKDRARSNAVSAQRRGENFNISRWAPVQRMGNPLALEETAGG